MRTCKRPVTKPLQHKAVKLCSLSKRKLGRKVDSESLKHLKIRQYGTGRIELKLKVQSETAWNLRTVHTCALAINCLQVGLLVAQKPINWSGKWRKLRHQNKKIVSPKNEKVCYEFATVNKITYKEYLSILSAKCRRHTIRPVWVEFLHFDQPQFGLVLGRGRVASGV